MSVYNPYESKQYDLLVSENLVRIVNDCSNILRKTKNPDTYIYRYDFLIQVLQELSIYEGRQTVKLSSSPRELWVNMESSFDKNMKGFIERCYQDCLEKISLMKTKQGKKRKIDEMYDAFTSHKDRLSQENISYYTDLCEQLYQKI